MTKRHDSVHLFASLCSTMTKLLDLLEYYLKWRELPGGKRMHYR